MKQSSILELLRSIYKKERNTHNLTTKRTIETQVIRVTLKEDELHRKYGLS